MENRIFGILTVGLAIVLYYVAYNYYKKNKLNYSLLLIILGGLLLRIFTAIDFHLHPWDERYHALVAKNLLNEPLIPMLYSIPLLDYDFKDWTSNHIWLHKQPFPLYTMALSMWIFGKNVIALRLPSVILSTLSIFATYRIGKTLDTPKVGLLAAFFWSVNGLIIEQTAGRVATDHIDVFFFSLITIAVFLLLRSVEQKSFLFLVLGSIVTGLAILSKWLPALIVLPVWFLYAFDKLSIKSIVLNLLGFLAIVTIIVLPWQLYILNNFPIEAAWEYQYNKKHIFEALGPHGKPFYFHFDRMRVIFGEIIYIPLIWLLITAGYRLRKKNYSKIILAVWILIPYLFFSFAITKMQGYILLCAGAIFIMSAMFFFDLTSYSTRYKTIKKLVLILLIILPVRYTIERVKPFSVTNRNPEWISTMINIESGTENQKAVVFNCKFPIETMFYTHMIAYQQTPQLKKLRAIYEDGYKIFIDNYKPLEHELKNLDFVTYIHITGTD